MRPAIPTGSASPERRERPRSPRRRELLNRAAASEHAGNIKRHPTATADSHAWWAKRLPCKESHFEVLESHNAGAPLNGNGVVAHAIARQTIHSVGFAIPPDHPSDFLGANQ